MVRSCGCPAAEVHCTFLSQPPLVERWRELTAGQMSSSSRVF
jgi:hypothetical protein